MYGDSLDALRGLLRSNFPEVTRIYVSTMPDSFIRPSFFINLVTSDEEHLNKAMYGVDMTWQIVYFAPLLSTGQADVFNQLDVSSKLKKLFMEAMSLTYVEPAVKSTGFVNVTVSDAVAVPNGTVFQTAKKIQFASTADIETEEAGTIEISVQAVKAGMSGNVTSNTIIEIVSEVSEVTAVTNPAATTGGVDAGEPVVFHIIETEGGPRDAEVYITVKLQTEMTRPKETYDLMNEVNHEQEG